mmetsp:Transcript_291/g.683  ORF Transcript_291/g.683 Transcript_291/m.683 type:complete len:245 (-) Transcript_291:60-794(-)
MVDECALRFVTCAVVHDGEMAPLPAGNHRVVALIYTLQAAVHPDQRALLPDLVHVIGGKLLQQQPNTGHAAVQGPLELQRKIGHQRQPVHQLLPLLFAPQPLLLHISIGKHEGHISLARRSSLVAGPPAFGALGLCRAASLQQSSHALLVVAQHGKVQGRVSMWVQLGELFAAQTFCQQLPQTLQVPHEAYPVQFPAFLPSNRYRGTPLCSTFSCILPFILFSCVVALVTSLFTHCLALKDGLI